MRLRRELVISSSSCWGGSDKREELVEIRGVEVAIHGRVSFPSKRKRLLLWGRRGSQRRGDTAIRRGTTATSAAVDLFFLYSVHVHHAISNKSREMRVI